MKEKTWDDVWAGGGRLNFLGKRLKSEEKKAMVSILARFLPERQARILDVGCGTGYTLKTFRGLGYAESEGVDDSPNSIKLCEKAGFKEGADVRLADAANLDYGDNEFELVFSEGLLEHFTDPTSLVREMCRVSKRFVLLFQPNSGSLVDRLKLLKEKTFGAEWQKDHPYTKKEYEDMFARRGFVLIGSGGINFGELIWLLFKR